MREVDDGPAELVDLVEDVVPEELHDVPVAGLGPACLVVVPSRRLDQYCNIGAKLCGHTQVAH